VRAGGTSLALAIVFALALCAGADSAQLLLPSYVIATGEPIELYADELDDVDQRYDIDEVSQGPIAARFRHGAAALRVSRCRWYRFTIPPGEEALGPWVLTTAETLSATLYEPGPIGYHAEPFGVDTPVAARRFRDGQPSVDIPHRDYGRTLYLRVVGPPEPETSFATAEAVESRVSEIDEAGIFFGTVYAVLASTALVFALITRDSAFGYYAVYMFAQVVNQVDDLPFLARLLWHVRVPSTVWFDSLYVGVSPLAFVAFLRSVLCTRDSPRLDRALISAGVVVALTGVALTVHDGYFGGNLHGLGLAVVAVATTLVGGVVAFVRWRKRYQAAGIYLIGLLGLAIAFALFPLTLGTIDTPDIGIVWEAVAFLVAIAYRLFRTAKDRELALAEASAADARALREYAAHVVELEKFGEAFRRFVPAEFLEQLGRRDAREVQLGDHIEREMSVLFCDIRSFVAMSDGASPQATFDFLNDYLGRVGPVVRAHRGFIDKYLGDGFLALFPGVAEDAFAAAIALQAEVRRFNEDRSRTGRSSIEVGVGIHRGRLMLATIGERERYETTVVADVVNSAARLEGLTRIYGARVMASESIVEALSDRSTYNLRSLGQIQVKGSSRAMRAFELFDADPPDVLLNKRASSDKFDEAMAAYASGEFERSLRAFTHILSLEPRDLAASFFATRSRLYLDGPVSEWDGVERYDFK